MSRRSKDLGDPPRSLGPPLPPIMHWLVPLVWTGRIRCVQERPVVKLCDMAPRSRSLRRSLSSVPGVSMSVFAVGVPPGRGLGPRARRQRVFVRGSACFKRVLAIFGRVLAISGRFLVIIVTLHRG
jgi:hypothetical protein